MLSGRVLGPAGRRAPAKPALSGAVLFTNEEFLQSLAAAYDPDDIDGTFAWVFSRLAPEVNVYPTENYYYFSFFANGRCYSGNLRLGAEERDAGFVNFCYWIYLDDPASPDDGQSWVKRYGAAEGVSVQRISPLKYAIHYGRKRVVFHLNRIPQSPPRDFRLERGEKLLARTFDESGFRFLLLFRSRHRHFLWVLDEEAPPPAIFENFNEEIVYDRLSGFAFFVDRKLSRKILIGVRDANVRRNNYWDGPFDQLADNFLHPDFRKCVELAYPYTKGHIDRYGKFTNVRGSRVAITPYRDYQQLSDLAKTVEECRKQPEDEFCACITYDYKTAL